MIDQIIDNWQAIGGTAIVTAIFTYISAPKIKKATEKKAEEEADSQGIQNLDKVLELNSREITKLENRFKEQLIPLQNIIANQKDIILNQKNIITEQKTIIETQNKYIAKLKKSNESYLNRLEKLEK